MTKHSVIYSRNGGALGTRVEVLLDDRTGFATLVIVTPGMERSRMEVTDAQRLRLLEALKCEWDGRPKPVAEVDMIECYFNPQVAAAIRKLREEHRLKLNLDYAFTHERNCGARVLCVAVYEETIREVFGEHGVPVISVSTYEHRTPEHP